jgi:hypothetical protein
MELKLAVADNGAVSFDFSDRGLHLPGGDALARSQTQKNTSAKKAVGILAKQPE